MSATENPSIDVLIVDDSAVVRTGLRALLETEEDMRVVGESGDGDQALRDARRLHPDVVLLDVRMPRRDGLSVVGELSADSAVVMMTLSDESAVIHSALQAGAMGYLVHSTFDSNQLAHMVRQCAAGQGAFSGPALNALRTAAADAQRPHGLRAGNHGLSTRQVEVMDLIASGKGNREIANELFVAEKTVKNHINQIFAALGVSSRTEAVARWLGFDADT